MKMSVRKGVLSSGVLNDKGFLSDHWDAGVHWKIISTSASKGE